MVILVELAVAEMVALAVGQIEEPQLTVAVLMVVLLESMEADIVLVAVAVEL